MKDSEILLNLDKKMSTMVALLSRQYEKNMDNESEKVEVLLHKLGFKAPEISILINKNTAAVQKTIQRSKK